jgi:HK97 family phage portal protein|nr:MAG TPA: portal protein [Caudoviricetes sp.]
MYANIKGGEYLGFDFWKFIKERLSGDTEKVSVQEIDTTELFGLAEEIYVREIAFWSIVNKISGAISKCEFKTYVNHEEVKGLEYYTWNIEPNKNQNSSAFFQKLIGTLYRKNECLVIEVNGQLLIADSFQKQTFALYDYIFTGVTVDNLTFDRTFYQSEVLYWELNCNDMRKLVNGIYESYKTMIAYGMKSYKKSRGSRGILDITSIAEGKENFKETYEKLVNERFKRFFNAENAVLPLFEGYSYTDIGGTKTYSNEGTRDIRAMIDDITDYTARAFSFPPALAKGDVQDTSKAIDELLTLCIDPLVDKLQVEINRKRNGFEGFKKGNYLKIITTAVKHIDLFDVSTSIDKLISSGAFCINDIRRVIGEEEINEEWANQHFITKNYSSVQDLLETLGLKTDKKEGGK